MSNLAITDSQARTGRSTSGNEHAVLSGVEKVIIVLLDDAGGATGTADDVDVFTSAAFGGTAPGDRAPESFIPFDFELRVTGNVAGSTVRCYKQAGAAGDPVGPSLSANAVAIVRQTAALDVDPLKHGEKFYVHRSDRAVTGQLIIRGVVPSDAMVAS